MVEIHDLHVRFHGASREAVAGIDLTIRDGEVVGLVWGIVWFTSTSIILLTRWKFCFRYG